MRRHRSALIVAAGSTLTLCWCGGSSFSPSGGADGGVDATDDTREDVVIVIQPPDSATDAHPGDGSQGDGSEADAHEAGCSAPTTLTCDGGCADPTSTTTCGTCGNTCYGPEAGPGHAVCEPGGTCAVACDSDGGDGGTTELLCSGSCVSPNDPTHCGTCAPCAQPPSGHGAPTCPAAQCVMTCMTGYHPSGMGCNADCTLTAGDDPSTDPCASRMGLGSSSRRGAPPRRRTERRSIPTRPSWRGWTRRRQGASACTRAGRSPCRRRSGPRRTESRCTAGSTAQRGRTTRARGRRWRRRRRGSRSR